MIDRQPTERIRHRRQLWQRIVLSTSLLSAAASAASSKGALMDDNRLSTSEHNLHRPLHPAAPHPNHRSLAINPNLINYTPHQTVTNNHLAAQTAHANKPNGFTQTELAKLSQQVYGAPHTWEQCPKSYVGYRASYNCKSYIYCSKGKMKEEGYVSCQTGLIFDNIGGMCVWEDEYHCDPDAVAEESSSSSSIDEKAEEEEEATTISSNSSKAKESDNSKNTYSKKMESVTKNPRFSGYTTTPEAAASSTSQKWSGHGDWGGYWLDGKWVDEGAEETAASGDDEDEEEEKGDGIWDTIEILSWSKEDITNFPLPQLQPYDLAQQVQHTSSSSTSTASETSIPRDFISQEGWSSQSRRSNKGKKVIGYYANWQWYSNQERPAPVNMQFTKVDRVNFAFFQLSVNGEIWGTDVWADGGILL